jgi:hypothetical protein
MAEVRYSEDVLEAVKENFDYLDGINHQEVATFLECVADSLYIDEGEFVMKLAEALRDVGDGVA